MKFYDIVLELVFVVITFLLLKCALSHSRYKGFDVHTIYHETYSIVFYYAEDKQYQEVLEMLNKIVNENQSAHQ